MAANTATSGSGTVSGTDPNFVLTYKTNNDSGIALMVKYTRTAAVDLTITFDVVNPSLHASDLYRMTTLSGTALSAYTVVISATGNYRIPVPIIASEKTIVANLTVGGAAQSNVIVANFMEG